MAGVGSTSLVCRDAAVDTDKRHMRTYVRRRVPLRPSQRESSVKQQVSVHDLWVGNDSLAVGPKVFSVSVCSLPTLDGMNGMCLYLRMLCTGTRAHRIDGMCTVSIVTTRERRDRRGAAEDADEENEDEVIRTLPMRAMYR